MNKRKKKGETIEEMQEKLLITPEKFRAQIEKEESEANARLPKKEIALDGETEKEQIENMRLDEMAEILLNLKSSMAWIAYKKYIFSRMRIVESSLFTMDPHLQGTEVARSQGIRMGLLDLDGYVTSLDEMRKKNEAD